MKIREYIGPYGAGKSTLCKRETARAAGDDFDSVRRADFRDFVTGTGRVVRTFWLLRHAWRYGALLTVISALAIRGTASDRYLRARQVARKAVYLREFARNRPGVYFSDEGILNDLCSCLVGTSSLPGPLTLRLLYGGLDVEFVWVTDEVEVCVRQVLERTQQEEHHPDKGEFLDYLYSGDRQRVREAVEFAVRFYGRILPPLADMYDVRPASSG